MSSDESYLVMKVIIVKEVKRSDGLWRFACGDVLCFIGILIRSLDVQFFRYLNWRNSYITYVRKSRLCMYQRVESSWELRSKMEERHSLHGLKIFSFAGFSLSLKPCTEQSSLTVIRKAGRMWHCFHLNHFIAPPLLRSQSESVSMQWACFNFFYCWSKVTSYDAHYIETIWSWFNGGFHLDTLIAPPLPRS